MVSNTSIQFMLYETLLKRLKKRRTNNSELPCSTNFLLKLSCFGWIFAWSFGKTWSYGCYISSLVVKSRLQAKQLIGGDKRRQYRGTLDAILKMICYEGLYKEKENCAFMDFLVNSGRSIYLLKKYLLNSQSLLWASTLLEMECRTKIGYLLLSSTGTTFVVLSGLEMSKQANVPVDETRKKIWLVDSKVTTGYLNLSLSPSINYVLNG